MTDRLVGDANPVEFATLEQLDDDGKQPFVGGKTVGNGAGSTEVVGGDRLRIAHNPDIHDPNSTLDEHRCSSGPRLTSMLTGKSSNRALSWRG